MRRATVVSRKDELGLEGQAELLHEARRTRSRARLSRDSIRERRALRTVPPEREEHILAQLVGISTDQTRMWPEIARLLEEAQIKDWSRPLVVVPPDGEAKNLKVQTFGSFEAVYAELVEPWLGSWAELRKTYAKFQAGEISQEQGAERIKALTAGGRVAAAAESTTTDQILPAHSHPDVQFAHQKAEDRAAASGISLRTQRKLDMLARKRPDLLEEVKAGRMSAHAAAVEAGIVKPTEIAKPSDNWNIATVTYDRLVSDEKHPHGYIPGDLYANVLHYCPGPTSSSWRPWPARA
jgi:hypothetical protein